MLSRFTPIITNCGIGQKKWGVQFSAMHLYNSLFQHKIMPVPKYNNIFKMNEYQHLYNSLVNTSYPLLLGGDHSIGQCSVMSSVYKYNDIKVIWIDAHADINTYESSLTKNKHGMPLSGCLGFDKLWFNPLSNKLLNKDNLIYVGLRDLDDFEDKLISTHNIKRFTTKQCLDYIKNNNKSNYHISFDVDALDPTILDSTGTIAKDGLQIKEVSDIIKECNNKLVALDVTEFNIFEGNLEKSITNLEKVFY